MCVDVWACVWAGKGSGGAAGGSVPWSRRRGEAGRRAGAGASARADPGAGSLGRAVIFFSSSLCSRIFCAVGPQAIAKYLTYFGIFGRWAGAGTRAGDVSLYGQKALSQRLCVKGFESTA